MTMRAFLTGASGFVGGFLRRHLESHGDEVFSLSDTFDLSDKPLPTDELEAAAPDVVYHLAALSHVGRSWEDPASTYKVNVIGTVNLLEAIARLARPPRVVLVSSSEVYGRPLELPVVESAPLRPVTPYAATKVAAEFAGVQAFLGRGIEVVRARPFNHVGPGRAPFFVVSALAKRLVEAELRAEGEIRVGELSTGRDFTDVRDVVAAYRLLAEHGTPGEVYNVCSGKAVPISVVLSLLLELSRAKVTPVEDPLLFRPVEVPLLYGDAGAIHEATGWSPSIELSDTLSDVIEYWRGQLL